MTPVIRTINSQSNARNMVIIGIYRPPRNLCGDHQQLLENELSQVCNWASLQSNSVVIIGDLNLNRLRSDKREGKLLLDLEIEQCFMSNQETYQSGTSWNNNKSQPY